ncbi:HutD family protein [Pseudomonas nitroreducens]|uniref:HutD/Ves family protein n=1 Tax=Pseudomonas nitroreducens TaxID=46680 RepID=UPI001473EBDF|nr:HutD family protein [Pseudomonas nitroreducens]MDG9856293.1 HutD family protein [Pseudomonas nitroreducens]MDH1073661.1 HutD family protein [Pseudomonas nitroreducens]NMZ71687.1 HutD family protein [Pseudomonas nitroreducens]
MSEVRILRAADYPAMPWKNGAGTTREIVRDAGDGLEGFGWRVSIADVGAPGPFSAFTGYQRVISVLEGEGMRLNVNGVDSRDLRALDAFAFDGASAVDCTLLGGAIRDFNLIYSPARYRARLQWQKLNGAAHFFSSASTVLLFSAGEGVHASLNGEAACILGLHDTLIAEGEGALREWRLTVAGGADICVIELEAR